MPHLTRRRFLTISAATSLCGLATSLPGSVSAAADNLSTWRGTALGAETRITFAHPQAERMMRSVRAELQRLEAIFSLYRTDSALARLNRDGLLSAPPQELVDCLAIAGAIHWATEGAFDPTIQPLWATYAAAHASGRKPSYDDITTALQPVGWSGVDVDTQAIRLNKAGAALTLNGIAQGYIADRIAALLQSEGLTDVMINTGELRALGGQPGGRDWDVTLAGDRGSTRLRDLALATSAPLGTAFDQAGITGHILDPRTGRPAAAGWTQVSVTAPSAAVADGLSTAFCLMSRVAIETALEAIPTAKIIDLA
ncbi:MAG: FAD:protein FMN transferase [Pannonibacter sp.]